MRAMKGIDLKEQMGVPIFVPARSTLPHHRVWEKPNQVVVTVQKPPPSPPQLLATMTMATTGWQGNGQGNDDDSNGTGAPPAPQRRGQWGGHDHDHHSGGDSRGMTTLANTMAEVGA